VISSFEDVAPFHKLAARTAIFIKHTLRQGGSKHRPRKRVMSDWLRASGSSCPQHLHDGIREVVVFAVGGVIDNRIPQCFCLFERQC
jgi:hypothetical protein